MHEICKISWNPPDFIKSTEFHEIHQISWNPPNFMHEICKISWNPPDFIKSTEFHAWNPLNFMKSTRFHEICQISCMKSAGFHEICQISQWNPQDFMKSAGFHDHEICWISWQWNPPNFMVESGEFHAKWAKDQWSYFLSLCFWMFNYHQWKLQFSGRKTVVLDKNNEFWWKLWVLMQTNLVLNYKTTKNTVLIKNCGFCSFFSLKLQHC